MILFGNLGNSASAPFPPRPEIANGVNARSVGIAMGVLNGSGLRGSY